MKKILSRRKFIGAAAASLTAIGLPKQKLSAKLITPPFTFPHALPDLERPGEPRNTKFAVNIEQWFKSVPFMQRVKAASDLGFPAIEFWKTKKKDRNIEEIGKLAKQHNIEVAQFTAWAFGTILNNPQSDHADFVKAIEEACAIADILPGCNKFTVVAGNNIEGVSKEDMHKAVIAGLKKAAPIVEKAKKTIIVEPMNPYDHPGHCLYGSTDSIAIMKAVGSPNVKLNWDLFHMQRSEGNIIDNMRKGKEYIGYLQLADSPNRREPGTGEINYTNVFQAIKAMGYNDYVGLECFPVNSDKVAATYINFADTW